LSWQLDGIALNSHISNGRVSDEQDEFTVYLTGMKIKANAAVCDNDEGEQGGICLLTSLQAPCCGSTCVLFACFHLCLEQISYSRAIHLLPSSPSQGEAT
jgi:hypothetical protein